MPSVITTASGISASIASMTASLANFGGITACYEVANGIVQAFRLLESRDEAVTLPLVVRLDGNNVVEGRQILADANHPLVTVVDTMDNAADKAAELAAAASTTSAN